MVMDVRALQSLNAEFFIAVRPEGKVMDGRRVQLSNAEAPIPVRPEGKVMDVRALQPENVPSPITETPPGQVTDVRAVQPENAEFPMVVTLSGIATLVILLFLRNASLPISLTGIPCMVAGMRTAVALPTYLVITAPVRSAVRITSKSASLFCAQIGTAIVTVNNINIKYIFFIINPL
jgi:hypothetical protein